MYVASVQHIFIILLNRYSESENRSAVSNSLRPHGLSSPWNSPGQNTGVDSLSLPQEIFPTQGSNPGLPNCRWILYHLTYQRSPKVTDTSLEINVVRSSNQIRTFLCKQIYTYLKCLILPPLH